MIVINMVLSIKNNKIRKEHQTGYEDLDIPLNIIVKILIKKNVITELDVLNEL